ncbi:MAG: citrate (Si)-synthase [Verrucomicrobia bacterium]|nr:citrate (Si)-synthase [Verrucomicrobiota bacterium]
MGRISQSKNGDHRKRADRRKRVNQRPIMTDVLFQITEKELETGMRGYPVGYCTTSTVDPQKGLSYVGHPIAELASWRPEEVIYLLQFGKEGSKKEIADFFAELQKRMTLKPETIAAIEKLPRSGHPMKLFSAAMLILGMMEGQGDYREDELSAVAKIPHLAAVVINYHAGWGKTPPSKPELGYMENFTQLLKIPKGDVKKLFPSFKLFNVLHFDHGGGNLSTFVGKAVASGLEDMYGSMCSALCALAGPRHGRANQDCLEFVREVHKEVGDNAKPQDVEALIRRRLKENKLVFGFGHAVLRVEDPRATVMFDYLQKEYPQHPLVKIALLLRTEGSKVLKENPKISDPYPNVDAISGTMLAAAGFDYPEYFTILFGLARTVGIARQIVYERLEARGGKGTPIIRPKYIYSGPSSN